MGWNVFVWAMLWHLLLVNGEVSPAQKETTIGAGYTDDKNEISLNPPSEPEKQDPFVKIKHSKSVLNSENKKMQDVQGGKPEQQEKQDPYAQTHSNPFVNKGEQKMDVKKQNEEPKSPQLNQNFQKAQYFQQPYQYHLNQNQNPFWTNPLSFISQNLFGNLGFQPGPLPPPPPQVSGSHTETLLHHEKNPALEGQPVQGFNPPSPSSHQEVAEAQKNWFEQQMKNMHEKVQNWFKV